MASLNLCLHFLLYHSLVKLLIDRPSILKERHNFIRKSFGEFLDLNGSLFLFFFSNFAGFDGCSFLGYCHIYLQPGLSTFACMYIRQRRLWGNSYAGQSPQR